MNSNSVKLTELISANDRLGVEEIKDNLGYIYVRINAENLIEFFTEKYFFKYLKVFF